MPAAGRADNGRGTVFGWARPPPHGGSGTGHAGPRVDDFHGRYRTDSAQPLPLRWSWPTRGDGRRDHPRGKRSSASVFVVFDENKGVWARFLGAGEGSSGDARGRAESPAGACPAPLRRAASSEAGRDRHGFTRRCCPRVQPTGGRVPAAAQAALRGRRGPGGRPAPPAPPAPGYPALSRLQRFSSGSVPRSPSGNTRGGTRSQRRPQSQRVGGLCTRREMRRSWLLGPSEDGDTRACIFN